MAVRGRCAPPPPPTRSVASGDYWAGRAVTMPLYSRYVLLPAFAAGGLLVLARHPDAVLAPEMTSICSDTKWLWAMPQAGQLMVALLKSREEVLKLLWKQKFHRATRRAIEQAPAVRKALAHAKLDLRFVIRDLLGRRLVDEQRGSGSAVGNDVLTLTPAGQQAANASMLRSTGGRKRKR